MKKFILKTSTTLLVFCSAILLIALLWDPYQVIRTSDNWNAESFSFNREWVCLNIYQNRIKKKSPPSHFIIGSSRSHAFKTADWSEVDSVSKDSIFHFDAFGMGLMRAHNLIHFLSQQQPAPKEFLWIIDHTIFNELEESDRFIFSEPPAISGKNDFVFKAKALYESLNPSFIFLNLQHTFSVSPSDPINGIEAGNQKERVDNWTGDIYYEKSDLQIAHDSIGFYNKKENTKKFKNPDFQHESIAPKSIQLEQLQLLQSIANQLKANNADIKIVISPLYSKVKFNPEDLSILKSLFHVENIFDYSGQNKWTKDFRNYYDPSHFRRHVAKEILQLMHPKKKQPPSLDRGY